jgi:hypothetical protein
MRCSVAVLSSCCKTWRSNCSRHLQNSYRDSCEPRGCSTPLHLGSPRGRRRICGRQCREEACQGWALDSTFQWILKPYDKGTASVDHRPYNNKFFSCPLTRLPLRHTHRRTSRRGQCHGLGDNESAISSPHDLGEEKLNSLALHAAHRCAEAAWRDVD